MLHNLPSSRTNARPARRKRQCTRPINSTRTMRSSRHNCDCRRYHRIHTCTRKSRRILRHDPLLHPCWRSTCRTRRSSRNNSRRQYCRHSRLRTHNNKNNRNDDTRDNDARSQPTMTLVRINARTDSVTRVITRIINSHHKIPEIILKSIHLSLTCRIYAGVHYLDMCTSPRSNRRHLYQYTRTRNRRDNNSNSKYQQAVTMTLVRSRRPCNCIRRTRSSSSRARRYSQTRHRSRTAIRPLPDDVYYSYQNVYDNLRTRRSHRSARRTTDRRNRKCPQILNVRTVNRCDRSSNRSSRSSRRRLMLLLRVYRYSPSSRLHCLSRT